MPITGLLFCYTYFFNIHVRSFENHYYVIEKGMHNSSWFCDNHDIKMTLDISSFPNFISEKAVRFFGLTCIMKKSISLS